MRASSIARRILALFLIILLFVLPTPSAVPPITYYSCLSILLAYWVVYQARSYYSYRSMRNIL